MGCRSGLVWLAVISAAGCVHAVPVVDAREHFAQVHQEAKSRAAAALKEAKEADRLVRRLSDLIEDRTQKPLPELKRLASAISAAAQSLRARARAIQKARTRLAKLGRGRTELRRNEPGWKLYETLQRDLARLDADSRTAYRNFQLQPDAIKRLCAEHGVGPMDTSGFGDRMGDKIKAMDAQVREASAHLERVEYLLEEESVDPESMRAVQAARVQLQAITETRAEVRRTALRFRLETKAGPDAVIAPGMVTSDLFERLDNLAADINASARRIQKLTQSLPSRDSE